jgi:hypothetical protein
MSGRLFKRVVAATIARQQAGGFYRVMPNAIVVSDLRVAFAIEKHLGSEPNTCTVTIYNLNEDSRAGLQRKPVHVRLDAGYDGDLQRLFAGDVVWAQSSHEGADWITKIQVGDGARSHAYANVSRTFKAGVDKRTVVKELAETMGLKMPSSLDDARELVDQFATGITLDGPSQAQMSKVLKSAGMSWSVQDGRLQVLRDGETRADQAILVNQSTGLVGVPDFGAPTEKGKKPVLTFKMLLYPGLTPGGKVKVQTRSINGVFRCERVAHTGDTHGSDWYSEVEATPV